jgi:hypothetical protein
MRSQSKPLQPCPEPAEKNENLQNYPTYADDFISFLAMFLLNMILSRERQKK